MPSLLSAALGWLQRKTGWTNSRAAWLERLGVVTWLGGAVAGFLVADRMTPGVKVLLAAVWLALLALLLRNGWLRLFGPVLVYELIRLARQPRHRWLRVGYAVALAALFTFIYVVWTDEFEPSAGRPVPLRAFASLAESFFDVYMVIQFLAVGLLTPAYVAGSIAEEKERKTLEFLLVTDLRDREIVFGKLAARVGNLTLFLLAGLPVLSLVQFFGGVDPDLLLAGFAATFITMLSLSAMSVFCSVTAKRARDAIALAFLIAFAYFAFSLMAQLVYELGYASRYIPVFGRQIVVDDLVYAFSCGNPVLTAAEVLRARSFGDTRLQGLRDFVLFHGLLIGAFVTWSVLRLRTVALRQSYGLVGGKAIERAVRKRPELGEDPIFWKEVFVDSGMKLSLLGRAVVLLVVLGSFAPVVVIGHETLYQSWRHGRTWFDEDAWRDFTRDINIWVRVAGTIVTCLLLLATAVRGSGSIRGERDRQTLDNLLTTPLSASRILWGKWWGCMLGLRRAWVWLGLIWLIGVASGGVHLAALPFMVLAVAVFASAYAWIGIWFSLASASTLRATLNTIMTGLFVGGGYFIVLFLCCLMPLTFVGNGPRGDYETLLKAFAGVSPAVVTAWLPMYDGSRAELALGDGRVPFIPFAAMGLIIWAAASKLLAGMALQRFREQTNRGAARREAFDV